MNYRPIGHMQKQFRFISETVQSSQNSSNSCTVQSLQDRFDTKLMSVRQIGHPRPSSRTRSAHVEQNRWCPHGTSTIRGLRGAIRHTSQLSLSVSGVSTWLSVWLPMSIRPHQHDQRRRRRRPSCRRQHHTACFCEHRHCELWTPTRELTRRIYFSRIILSPISHFHVSHLHVSHFLSVQFGAAFSWLAFSFLAFSASREGIILGHLRPLGFPLG